MTVLIFTVNSKQILTTSLSNHLLFLFLANVYAYKRLWAILYSGCCSPRPLESLVVSSFHDRSFFAQAQAVPFSDSHYYPSLSRYIISSSEYVYQKYVFDHDTLETALLKSTEDECMVRSVSIIHRLVLIVLLPIRVQYCVVFCTQYLQQEISLNPPKPSGTSYMHSEILPGNLIIKTTFCLRKGYCLSNFHTIE